jgi:dihydroflavonol-4-reductase
LYPYFEAKVAMERAVIGAAREGLPVVVINPAACLGPWEFRAEEMSFVHLVLSRRLPMVMEQVINVIDVRDVAMAIELALAREYFGSPIPLAGHDIAMATLAIRIAALGGVAAPMGIDSRVASAAGFWVETAFAALGSPAPDLVGSIPLIADGFPMRPSPEQLAIGLSIRPLDDTLRDAVAFHRERRPAD